MIDYVQEKLAGETPRCRLEYLAADLTDPAQHQRVFERAAGSGPVLTISEGLLIYLEPEQVADLARELHGRDDFRWWLIDLASPMLLKMLARTWGSNLAAGNAPMRFAPEEGTAFFAPLGWREAEFRSTWEESQRLKRTVKLAWLWNLLGRLTSKKRQEAARRMSGIVLLERT
jgi:O-methyltransferase involved in polyketide biosynthesis